MSYSDVSKEIEIKGFIKALIDEFENAEQAYSEVCSLTQQLESANVELSQSSGNLEFYIRHAALNCNEFIIDSSKYGLHIIRVIDDDVLYEIIKDENTDKITWSASRCNKLIK